jgi:hypothetical protein
MLPVIIGNSRFKKPELPVLPPPGVPENAVNILSVPDVEWIVQSSGNGVLTEVIDAPWFDGGGLKMTNLVTVSGLNSIFRSVGDLTPYIPNPATFYAYFITDSIGGSGGSVTSFALTGVNWGGSCVTAADFPMDGVVSSAYVFPSGNAETLFQNPVSPAITPCINSRIQLSCTLSQSASFRAGVVRLAYLGIVS